MNLLTEIYSNTVQEYLIAVGIFILLLAVFRLFHYVVLWRLHAWAKHTTTEIDDTVIRMVQSVSWPFYVYISLYVSVVFMLSTSEFVRDIVDSILIIFAVYQVVKLVNILAEYVVKHYVSTDEAPEAAAIGRVITRILKGIVWVVGILFMLSNLGVNVTSFIATLGIGGVAVALALQNILGDLFSSFAIYLDKPFTIGDFIVVGDKMGTVEHIGIKTTRLRALQGEELVMSNRELTSAQIQNYKKMQERRVVFGFGVVYETPADKLRKASELVREIIEDQELARFDRAHFHRFDEWSLAFEVVYFVHTSDYNRYMDIHQNIHLSIKEAFEKEGIEMAYPTRTIYTHETKKSAKKNAK